MESEPLILKGIVAWGALHADPAQLGELLHRRATAKPTPSAFLDSAKRHLRLIMNGLIVYMNDA
jgi:hypothetical protein